MIRLAARGIVMRENRLLLVNAYGGNRSDLMCCPGGGVEPHQSLPDNLAREIHEECGIAVEVGEPVLLNEFNDPERGFHQVEVFFRCEVIRIDGDRDWRDPEGIVHERVWVTRDEIAALRVKPSSLPSVAWGETRLRYDRLEMIVP